MYRSIVMPGPRIKFGAGSCAGRPGIHLLHHRRRGCPGQAGTSPPWQVGTIIAGGHRYQLRPRTLVLCPRGL